MKRFDYLTQADGGLILLGDLSGALIIGFSNVGNLIQDPRRLTFMQWASTIVSDQNVAAVPVSEAMWKQWAESLYQTVPLAPDPLPFQDWREWALAWLGTT